MNKIYKVIWSKVKHQYVVVSELAHSNGKQSRTSRNSIRSRIAALVVCGAIAAFGVFNALPNSAYAADSDYIAFVTTEKGQNANENQGDTIQINGYKYTSTRIAKPDNSYTWYWVRDGYNIQLERLERPGSDGSKDYVVRAFKDGGGEVETSLVHSYQNKIEDTGVTTLNGKNLHSYEAGVYAGGSNGYTAVRMEDKWSEADQTFKPNNDPMIFDGKEWRQAERTDFKDVKFNEETGNYEYNGQIVATENLYVVDFVKTKGNDTEVEGTKLGCFVVDGKVYTGTVHGKNNEILMTGITGINEDNKYVTYWASEYTDEKATMAQMPISQYKETISGLASDINAIHQDDIKEIQINQIDNGGSINLQTNGEFVPARDEKGDIITDETGKPVYVAQGGKNIPGGITIRNTTNSGSEGNDVAVEISNDKNSFTVDAGSKVVGKITTKNGVEEAGVGDANKTLTGLKINGVDYALSQGKTYSNGNGISIDEENNKISVNAGDGLTFGTEQTNDKGKLKVNVGDGLSIKDGQVINNLKVTADTNATKNNKNGGNWTVTDSKANITLTNTTLDEADSNSYNSDENNLIKDDSNANNNTKYGRNYKVFDTDGNEVALNDVASADTLKTIDTTKIGDLKYNDFTEGDSDTTSIVKNDDNLTTAVGKLDNAVNETKTLAGKHTKMTVNDGTLATTDGEYNSDGNLQLKQTVENDQTTYDVKLNDNITLGKDTPSQININGNPSEGEAALSIGNKFIVGQDGSIQSTVKTGTVTEKVSTFNFDKDGVNIKSAVNGKETSTLINGGTVTIKDSNTDYTLIKGEKITAGDIKLNAQENKSTILGLTNTEWNDTVKENVKNNASEATVAATQGQLLDATKLAVQYDNSDKDSVILGGSKNYIEGTAEDKGGVELTNVAYATGADKSQAVNVEYLEDKTGNLQYNAGSETDNDEISIVQNGEDLTTAVGKLDNAVNEAKTEAGKHTKMTVNDGISAPELEEGQTEGTYSKDGNLQLKQKVNNGQTTYDIKLNPDVNLKGEGKNSDNRVWLSGSNGTITATTEKNLPKKTTVINGGNVYVGSSVSVGANDDVVITDKDITGLSNTTWDETLADKVENDNVLKGTAATQGQLLDVQEAVDTATTLAGKHTIVTVNDGISAPELEEGQTEGTYSKDGNLQLKQKVNNGQTTYDIKLNPDVNLKGEGKNSDNRVWLSGSNGTITATTEKNLPKKTTVINGGNVYVGSSVSVGANDDVVITDKDITGLSNTTWDETLADKVENDNVLKGTAATQGQLLDVQEAVDTATTLAGKHTIVTVNDGISAPELEEGQTEGTYSKDGNLQLKQKVNDGQTTYDIKLNSVVTLDGDEPDNNNVVLDGNKGTISVTNKYVDTDTRPVKTITNTFNFNDEGATFTNTTKNGKGNGNGKAVTSFTNIDGGIITVSSDARKDKKDIVIDGDTGEITGLSNTTWTGTTETPNRAATEGQLQNAYDGSVKYWRNEDGTYDKSFIQLEGGEEGTTITHLKDGVVAEYSTEAINGSQLWETQQQIKDVETTANKHTIVSTTDDSNLTVKNVAKEGEADNYQVTLNDEVVLGDYFDKDNGVLISGNSGTISATNSITVGEDQGLVIDGQKKTIQGLSNTTWTGTTETPNRAATEGQLQNAYDGSVKYWRNEDGTYDKSFIQLEGGEEGTTITHLKDGVVAEYSTEAINGSQLWETQQQIKDVETTANKHTIVSTTKDSNLTVKNVAGEGEADNYQVALKDDITLKGDSSSIELTGTKGTIQVNQETAEGTNFTNINGNVVSIGYTNSEGIENAIVIDGGEGTITGLSNTTWDGKTDNASRVATEGQLKAVSDTVNAGWIATDNSGKEVAVNPDNNKLKFAGDDNITVSATTDENNNNAINVKLNDNITLGNGQSAITLNGSPENSNDPALSVGTDKFVVDQDGSLSVSDKFNVDAETGNIYAANNSGSAIMMNDDSVALNAGGNGIAISDEGILLNTNGINEDIKLVTKGTSVSVDSNGTTFTNTNTNETTNINGGTINVGDKLMVEEDGSIYATNNNGSTVMINDDGIALNSEGNGVVVSDDGITLNANGSAVTVDRFNGTTFTNTNTGETTSINGGTITTDTVKGLSNTTWNDELATQVAKSEELQGTAATQGQLQQAVSAVATEAAKQHTTVSGDDNLTVKSSVNENGGTNYQVTLDDDITLGNPKAGNTEGERSFTINTTDPEGYVPESYKTGSGADFIEENGGFMLFATDTQGFGVFGVTAKGSAWAKDFETYTTDIYGNNTKYSLNEIGDAVAQMSSYYNEENGKSYTVFSRYLNEAEKDNPFVTVDDNATRDIPLALRDDGAVLIGATIKGEDFTDNGIRINAETETTYDEDGNEVTNNIATITGLENTEWKPPTPVATFAANDINTTSRAATEAQLNDLYNTVAAYDVNADGTVNYNHITLAGTPYNYGLSRSTDGTPTGGTSITNVAYASGNDGSEAVNVDYLKDAIKDAVKDGPVASNEKHLDTSKTYTPDKTTGKITIAEVDGTGQTTGNQLVINDVASKAELDSLKTNVGDLSYSKVQGDDVKDGDSVTTAIGKLDNKIENISGTATDADNNTVTGGKINSDGTISLTQKDKDSIKLEGQLTDSGVVQEGTSFDKETGTITITSQDKYSGETSSVKVEGIASTEVVGATNKEDLATAYKDADKDGNATTEYITDSESMVEADVALDHAIQDVAGTSYANDMVLSNRIDSVEKRLGNVEERIDKVGAMAAAIANLRTMGFDPEAPTEIAIGVGQYKSETGIAIGVFHYPNQDFMLSASLSSSGDELMGGIGATWKLGRKSAAERAKDEEARHLEQAEEMKKLAQQEKVKAQAQRHAKLLAERQQASQKNA